MACFLLIIGQGGCGNSGINVGNHHELSARVLTHKDRGTDTHEPGTLQHHALSYMGDDYTVHYVVCVCVGVRGSLGSLDAQILSCSTAIAGYSHWVSSRVPAARCR